MGLPIKGLYIPAYEMFPLIKLAKKLKADTVGTGGDSHTRFPLIKLAKKLKVLAVEIAKKHNLLLFVSSVSIN